MNPKFGNPGISTRLWLWLFLSVAHQRNNRLSFNMPDFESLSTDDFEYQRAFAALDELNLVSLKPFFKENDLQVISNIKRFCRLTYFHEFNHYSILS